LAPTATNATGTDLPRRGIERALQFLEYPNHAQSARAVRARLLARADAVDEVLAFDAKWFHVRDPRREDVATASDVLAVGPRILVKALVVDGQLSLHLHVIERRHPAGPDDGEAPFLVRVEPGEVEVGGQAGGEAQEAEDDVLNAVTDV
jgi:hypothetical protein